MALLFCDSFDHYATADISSKWPDNVVTTGSSNITIASSSGRNSTGALKFTYSANNAQLYVRKAVTTASATAIAGFAFFPTTLATSANTRNAVLSFWDTGAAIQCSLRVNTDGSLSFLRGTSAGTVLGTSAAGVIPINAWSYIEVKVVMATSAGAWDVHVNGASVVSGSSNTANNATTTWNAVSLLANTGNLPDITSNFWYFEDFYVADGAGSVNNSFLGDVRVKCSIASAGNGTNAQFTPSTGVDHGALVDESTPNTSDYNSDNVAGHRDTYNFPSLGLTGTVLGLQTVLYAAKADAGARTVAPCHRISGTNYDGTAIAPSTSFSYLTQVYETSPATAAAWTTTEINATETGMKVVS